MIEIIITFLILSYNNEDTIQKAINSIVFSNIDKNDYEIIIVDDGSVDNTINIINKFIINYENIKLFHTDKYKKNTKNQSVGRNIGIKNSKSKYIRFLDGDDYFNSIDLYNDYLYLSKISGDIVISNRITNRGNYIDNKDYRSMIYDGIGNYYVNTKLLRYENIVFDETKYNWYSEDIYFFILIYDKCKKMDFINNDFTYYCIKKPNSNSDLSILKYEEIVDLFDYYTDMKFDLMQQIDKYATVELLESLISIHMNTLVNQLSCGNFK